MNFQRFGNAFVALHDDRLYVVSLYLSAWNASYRLPGMDKPKQIGLYGYPTPEEAMGHLRAFVSELNK